MGTMGCPGALHHPVAVIRAGEDFQRLIQDLAHSPNDDARAVACHGRGVVFLLAGNWMVEDLGEGGGEGLRAAHTARLRDQRRGSRHKIPHAISESEKGRRVPFPGGLPLQTLAGAIVRAAEHGEMHGRARLEEEGHGFLQLSASEPAAHHEHDREVVILELEQVPTNAARVGGLLEERVYRDAGRVYLLLRHPEPRNDLRRRFVGDDVEVQVRGHPDRVRHVIRQYYGGECPGRSLFVISKNTGAVEVWSHQGTRCAGVARCRERPRKGSLRSNRSSRDPGAPRRGPRPRWRACGRCLWRSRGSGYPRRAPSKSRAALYWEVLARIQFADAPARRDQRTDAIQLVFLSTIGAHNRTHFWPYAQRRRAMALVKMSW